MPIEDKKPTVESLGRNIFLVDPNPPGMTMHPPEDMFIYVKFSAKNRDRTTFVGNDISGNAQFVDTGTLGEIDFIATNIKYDDEGNIITNNKGKQETYATTNYTNIGGIKESNSRGVLEGFGIKTIDIKYNASLVPQVDITFTDIRGAGLFDVISEDNRRSPYSIFFKLPYPIFTLSVKGYFGKTVDYCLHMTDWNSNFDGSTGNFDITANFVGFQQAFLADMVLGNVIGAVNTKTGYNKLMEVFNDEQNKNPNLEPIGQNVDFDSVRNSKELNIRKIDDFFLKASKLQIEAETIKEQTDSFDELKTLNTQLSKLKRIQTFIGQPLPKEDSNIDTEYELKPNDPNVDVTAAITDNFLTINRNYLSLRDYIVFKSINIENVKEYFVTLKNLIDDYNTFISNADANGELNKNNDSDLLSAFSAEISTDGQNYYKSFLSIPEEESPITLDSIFDRFTDSTDSLYLGISYSDDNENNVNSNFNPSLFFNDEGRKKYLISDGMSDSDAVLVIDFRAERAKTQKRIDDVEVIIKEKRKTVQEELNEKLNEKLSFNPNIKNIFRVLANNVQAMLATLYDVSSKAEAQQGRKSALGGVSTDVPPNSERIYPWPSIYRKTDGGGDEEIYIGELNGGSLNRLFPEYEFVEEVFDVLVSRTRELEQVTKATSLKDGLDNDNWFPLNPLDYNVNPFLNVNVINTELDIRKELIKQLVVRNSLLTNYSNFNKSTGTDNISSYGEYDGINANRTIFSSVVRSIITTNFKTLSPQNILNEATQYGYITPSQNGSDYILNEEDSEVSGIKISGKRSNDVDYILIGKDGIINNSKKLWDDIENKNSYSKIYGDTREISIESDPFFNNFYSNNNFTSNLYYNVWLDKVNRSLIKENNGYNKYLIDTIELIDPKVGEEGEYINILNPNKSTTNESDFEQYVTDSELFTNQTSEYSKALLLLSSLPFDTFERSVLRTLRNNDGDYVGARIVKLPKYYLYYIGGLLLRQSGDYDIDFTVSDNKYLELQTPTYKYLTNLGANSGREEIDLEEALTFLPTQTKDTITEGFKKWVDTGGFNKFTENIVRYKSKNVSNFDENIQKTARNKILGEIKIENSLILLAPEIFNKEKLKDGLVITPSSFSDYYRSFIRQFEETDEDNNKGTTTNSEEDLRKTNGSENKIKLEIYNYFKNINDKWVGSEKDGKVFNACGTPGNNLIDYFKFIDRGWSDIGDRAVINLNSLLTIGDNLNTNMYFFIAKILRDSNFLFQILPSYVNFKDPTEVSEMFMPIPNVSEKNRSSGPIYTCIYVGGASKALDIGESNDYYWSNDGFSFRNGQIPDDINSDRDFGLVAFRVAFGAENQTIFKNVALNQQEHKETAEYFRSLSDLVDKRGGTQKSYQGTDLLRVFKTRSYTCKVEALGCMNIQPLMYFDLQNVPFFNGAYLITSVSHSITPNHMITNFTGVRQSKFITSYVEDVGVFLDIDLNEVSDESVVEFTNLENTDPIYKIGVLDPNEPFDQDLLTIESLQQIGIKDGDVTQFDINGFKTIMSNNNIISNTQVTMFLSNIMSNSDYLLKKQAPWETKEPIENYSVTFGADSDFSGQTKYYNPDYFFNKSQPEFINTGDLSNIVYNPPGNTLQNSFGVNGGLGNSLGNTQDGDSYRYRQRGYIYINGKRQYNDILGETSPFIISPNDISNNIINAFNIAALVWSNRGDENGVSSNQYTSQGEDPGTSSVFYKTVSICQPYDKNVERSFTAFNTVLSTFNLLDTNKP